MVLEGLQQLHELFCCRYCLGGGQGTDRVIGFRCLQIFYGHHVMFEFAIHSKARHTFNLLSGLSELQITHSRSEGESGPHEVLFLTVAIQSANLLRYSHLTLSEALVHVLYQL